MRHQGNLAALAAVTATLLAACSGSGGGSAGSGSSMAASYGLIDVIAHVPADGAVQVPLATAIVVEFDAAIALDSLGDEDTWLRASGSTTNVPGRFASSNSGHRVTFTPQSQLARETDYTFQLSGMTCDDQGRLLDAAVTFSFRTLDETAPVLQHAPLANLATGVSRTDAFTYTFSEAIAASSLTTTTLRLRDVFGATYAGERSASGNDVTFAPFADLPGDRQFTLELTGAVTDRAGNALGTTSTLQFTTASDPVSPTVLTMWPAQSGTGISPAVQPTYTFSESMDPGTVEPASLAFQDQFGSIVPFAIHSSDDQRTLRVEPLQDLQPNRTYTLAFLLGAAATTDVSGNVLTGTQALQFTTGTDAEAPAIASTDPHDGATRVSRNAVLQVTFDEALDPVWVDEATVVLTADGEELVAVVETPTANVVRITPVLDLPTDTTCVVTLRGGHEGLHDTAGNVLAADASFTFTTSADATLPRALMAPPDGATGVPLGAHVSIVFDAAMDPTTVNTTTVQVMDDLYNPVPGTLELLQQNRVARFTPTSPLQASSYYRTRVHGGSSGVRRTTGNWFTADQDVRFRTGVGHDSTPPIVTATLNGIDASRTTGLVLPNSGFTVDVAISDPGDQSLDMGSVEVLMTGTGSGPSASTLFAAASVGYATFHVSVPATAALGAGSWSLRVRATDLSGNASTSTPLDFEVTEAVPSLMPFERVQVVWVRTDLDRDGTGTADFDEDLLRLGLNADGDPVGANTRLRELLLDGIIAVANSAYGRGTRGEPLDSGSVWLRFTKRAPIAVSHMQMALGGFDPEGAGGRHYGGETTGVLGRALYDYKNGNFAERNTGTRPGLGVFPAEMWLYQTSIHEQVWPSYQTVFAQRFRPLAPDMGGVPAGTDPLDAVVLAPGFDYDTAPGNQRARYLTVMRAIDDWATVMGIILAHEVGHSVGLVAPGGTPRGLYGDSTLHDTYAGASEIMAPAVGYEAMLSLEYRFRDVDLAYLRQRILLR